MDRLRAPVRDYAWGDTVFIAELQGRRPTDEPEAELWMGAHPGAPSVLEGSGESLAAHIAADLEASLGDAACFGELPFLAKVLAAAEPLSIQVHPSRRQARDGFERENAQGLALDDPTRCYRDPHHKPELVCALTPFDAKCGFRPTSETRELIASLDHAALGPLEERLGRPGDDAEVLADVLQWLLTDPDRQAATLAEALAEIGSDVPEGPWSTELAWSRHLHDRYPGDPGVVVALLLNHVRLEPGQALALGAGVLHSYLQGAAIEVMANSDNVVRGGLTPKHVDTVELARITDCRPQAPRIQVPHDAVHTYHSTADEFELSRLVLDGRFTATVTGPEILIVTDGHFVLTSGSSELDVAPGQPVWVDAADRTWTTEGAGTLFRATVPVAGRR
jgi:mannose-6-phosphate isomerase